MFKTYRIIPLVFILFLFGFTLITVAPVFAQTDNANEGIAANKRMMSHDGPPGMPPMADMSTPEERCAGAPTDEERANCIAANKRMMSHDGPRDGMRGEHHDGPRDGPPEIPIADMSTPEARCAGAPTDEERENCIAANKEMGDDRRDGPGQASDSTVVGSTGDGCAGLSMDELANCITLNNRENSIGIIQAIYESCMDTYKNDDEEMANCIGDKKRAAALPTNHPTPAERAERDRIAEVARLAAEAEAARKVVEAEAARKAAEAKAQAASDACASQLVADGYRSYISAESRCKTNPLYAEEYFAKRAAEYAKREARMAQRYADCKDDIHKKYSHQRLRYIQRLGYPSCNYLSPKEELKRKRGGSEWCRVNSKHVLGR
jgi:hypothetical protein